MKHIVFKSMLFQRYIYLLIGLLCGINLFAQDFSYEYLGKTLKYTIVSKEDRTCKTKAGSIDTAGNNVSGSLEIPETVIYKGDEYTVITIGEYSFNGCNGITSVTIPKSITSIQKYAFCECGLTSINIPSTVTSMDYCAFLNCRAISVYAEDLMSWCNIDFDSLTSNPLSSHGYLYIDGEKVINLSLPEGIKTLKSYTFTHCRSLLSVEFPSTLITIGANVFDWCYELSNINFSKCNSLKTIGESAFEWCGSLTNIDLSNCESLINLGKSVFSSCGNLQNVNILGCKSLQYIPSGMFYGCGSLSSINLSNLDNLYNIGSVAFAGCALNYIDLTGCDNLNSIDCNAFQSCRNIKEVRIKKIEDWMNIKFVGGGVRGCCYNPISASPSNAPQLIVDGECLEYLELPTSVTTVNKYAFNDYAHLKSVKFNSTLTSIEDYAFDGCYNIANLNFDNCVNLESIGTYAFAGADNGWGVKILDLDLSSCLNLRSIFSGAFSYCENLKSVILPSNIRNLEKKAFASNTNLKYVVCKAIEPPVCESDVFNGSQLIKDGTLFVPREQLNSYEFSSVWGQAKNIVPLDNLVEAESIYFNKTSVHLGEGDNFYLKLYTYPENSYMICDTYWNSLNTNIATVDKYGKVTAVSPGETTIRARYGNSEIYTECHVVVTSNPIKVENVILSQEEWMANVGDEIDLVATVLPEDALDKTLTWSSSDSDIVNIDENGHAKAIATGEAWIRVVAASNPEIYAECHVTVNGPVVAPEIIWDQEFRCAVGESVELTGYSSDGNPILYESIVPDGGFQQADIYDEDGKFMVSFPAEGAYILTAKTADKAVEKRFNVVPTHEGLMQIDGIYYRFTDDQRLSLKVVRGYDMYCGDYVIPSKANGITVTSIDDKAFYSCMELNDVEVQEGILLFGSESFGNSTLHSISIPSTVKSLAHNYIFNALTGILQSISIHGNIPPEADETTFNGFVNYDECIVHIPEGSYPLYRTAPIWENFKYIIEDLPGIINIERVVLSQDEWLPNIGDEINLVATIIPDDSADKTLEWSSSDSDIVSVDENGHAKALAAGEVWIRVSAMTNAEVYAECHVVVTPNPIEVEKLVLSQEEWLAKIGDEIDLVASVLPEDATDKLLNWSSSNLDIVSVDENGHTVAIAAGEAWIRVCAATNPEIYVECHVVVSPNTIEVEKIVLSQDEWLAKIGDEIDLVAYVLPEDATDKTLTWSSSDPNIVRIEENGHAVAVAAGETWIRVCVASNPEIYAECSVVVSPNVIVVEKVILSQDEWLAKTGDEIDLAATALPDDATDKTLTWTSSDPNIVGVDENGHTVAVAAGEAWIRVSAAANAEVYAECHVVVTPNLIEVEKVTLSQDEWFAKIG
ncbi:MAG: leucine-rich repeat protein, partial [Muribaculaceae bacterium]|nr:leucine-rich repeat protein [Muribaculaceae bacterium]